MRCTYCGKTTHTLKNCPKTWAGSDNRKRMRCGYCGSRKHYVEVCPKTWSGSGKMRDARYYDKFILD